MVSEKVKDNILPIVCDYNLGWCVKSIVSACPFLTTATNQGSRYEVSFCHRN